MQRTNADGIFQFSAILSLKSNNAIKIQKIPATEIAVSERCMKKSPQQHKVIIGVPNVNTIDTPLKMLYLATLPMLIPRSSCFSRRYSLLNLGSNFFYSFFYVIYFVSNSCFKFFDLFFQICYCRSFCEFRRC